MLGDYQADAHQVCIEAAKNAKFGGFSGLAALSAVAALNDAHYKRPSLHTEVIGAFPSWVQGDAPLAPQRIRDGSR